MKTLHLVIGLSLVLGLGLPLNATAQDYSDTGWYVGAGLGLGFEQFSDTGGVDIGTGIGFDVWAGYRLFPYLAVEGVRFLPLR